MKPKTVALLLALTFTVALLSGCQSATNTSASPSSTISSNASAPATTTAPPAVDATEPTEITIFGTDIYTGEVTLNDGATPAWQQLEEMFNIKFKFNVTPQYAQNITVRLASGQQLEDLFCIGYTNPTTYITEGLFQPLDDLIAEHAPNLTEFYRQYPNGRTYNTYPTDGKQYAISESETLFMELGDVFVPMIRKDWLDALGLQKPTSTDELLSVLTAFRDNKMGGGNPVILADAYGSFTSLLSPAFGLDGFYGGYLMLDANGNVYNGRVTDAYKELLRYMNLLYTENLLPAQLDQLTTDICYEMMAADNCAMFMRQTANIDVYVPYLSAGDENAALSVVGPLKGPGGENPTYYHCYTDWKRYIIPSTSEDAEIIIKMLDYTMGTEEGRNLLWYGVEGESVEYVDGMPKFTDAILNAESPQAEKANLGLQVQCIPTVYAPLTEYDFGSWNWDISNETRMYSDALHSSLFLDKGINPVEVQELIDLPDLGTYLAEMELNFITGVMDIDDGWDEYLSTAEELGMSRMVAGYQMRYDMLYK